MVGARTVAIDDPLLTDRTAEPRRRPLVRVVLDAGLHTGLTSQLVRTAKEAPLLIFSAEAGPEEPSQCLPRETGIGFDSQREALEASGVEVVGVPLKGDLLDVRAVLGELGRRGITSVIVEGGSGVAGSLFDEGLVDKVTFFVAPKIMGGEGLAAVGGMGRELSDAIRLKDLEIRRHGEVWKSRATRSGNTEEHAGRVRSRLAAPSIGLPAKSICPRLGAHASRVLLS